ncbi:glycosyl hydrolase family 38 protein [Trichuris suis]|nr:glycosyl hydrolase family 38 protein [Trichuris suis]
MFGFRRTSLFATLCVFLISSYILYSLIDSTTDNAGTAANEDQESVKRLEDKLEVLEIEAKRNEEMLGQIQRKLYWKFVNAVSFLPRPVAVTILRSSLNDGSKEQDGRPSSPSQQQQKLAASRAPSRPLLFEKYRERVIPAPNHVNVAAKTSTVCKASADENALIPYNGVQMLDLYEKLRFDNPDGGKWKQGWDVQYDKAKTGINGPKLKVFVVPHSHTDPGWVKTFEEYYTSSVEGMFDSMLDFLSRTPKAKFIYAEMSFFERWWKDTGFKERENLLELLRNGQLEIVTGAWVQTDEANSHYFSMIDQLIEGQQWLYNHVGFIPKNHWSIDPFGLSPTMAHLVHLTGIKTLAIQRVHYSIKKYLASTRGLEFFWRQLWNNDSRQDAFTHLFPFYSYDIPHTCGPDPSICCQFDFIRYKGSTFSCPWGFPAQPIDELNILERASVLLDQYRKHAQLYRGNVLLIPLGDDFRYVKDKEWRMQYDNYAKLFDFMNAQKEWNVQIQFGTLEDYFSALEMETREHRIDFPTLSGDFFSYADRDDDYWVGYFTSRPFYKRMERTLAHHVRGAEIIYNSLLSRLDGKSLSDISYPASQLFEDLVSARRNLALFQHHDGITGTAKTYVMRDYGVRLVESIDKCKKVIAASVFFLMNNAPPLPDDMNVVKLDFADEVLNSDRPAEKVVINVVSGLRTLVFYNSLPYGRSDIVCIHTDKSSVKLFDAQSRPVEIQISPYVKRSSNGFIVSVSVYEICWLSSIDALGLVVYELKGEEKPQQEFQSLLLGRSVHGFGGLPVKDWPSTNIQLHNSMYKATFSRQSGMMEHLAHVGGSELDLKIQLLAYKSKNMQYLGSGAYLFHPSGPAEPIGEPNALLLVNGSLHATIYVGYEKVLHEVRIVKAHGTSEQAISIRNTIDLTDSNEDYEIVMRLVSNMENPKQEFFSDLNGLQMIKRRYFRKLPLQGNFYPMPSAAFIEDHRFRLTLLSGQPGAVASLSTGSLEVMLDRRTHLDDQRGVSQSMTDNIIFTNRFSLLLEKGNAKTKRQARLGYLTMLGFHQSMALLYPLFQMYSKDGLDVDFRGYSKLAKTALPCDYHMVNFRSIEGKGSIETEALVREHTNQSLLILHRPLLTCRGSHESLMQCESNSKLTASSLFGGRVKLLEETSLTMLYSKNTLSADAPIDLKPMDIKSYRITWL